MNQRTTIAHATEAPKCLCALRGSLRTFIAAVRPHTDGLTYHHAHSWKTSSVQGSWPPEPVPETHPSHTHAHIHSAAPLTPPACDLISEVLQRLFVYCKRRQG